MVLRTATLLRQLTRRPPQTRCQPRDSRVSERHSSAVHHFLSSVSKHLYPTSWTFLTTRTLYQLPTRRRTCQRRPKRPWVECATGDAGLAAGEAWGAATSLARAASLVSFTARSLAPVESSPLNLTWIRRFFSPSRISTSLFSTSHRVEGIEGGVYRDRFGSRGRQAHLR